MSLDDRLRQGLQTLDEPETDAARELERFRSSAYPRRARRRIMQAALGTLAAAAIIAGVTTAVTNSARKAPPFLRIPSNVAACGAGDVEAITGYEGRGQFSISVFSTKGACKIDETFAANVTSNVLPFVAAAPVHPLAIQGNGAPTRFQGIVPSESNNALLTIAWKWTNWCGPDRSFTLAFHRISGTTKVLEGEDGTSGSIATVPSCNDASKPSVMSAGPATLTPRIAASGSSGPAYDKNPHIIAPRSGLTNLIPSPVNQVLVRPDDKTLVVSFTHGAGCHLFARIAVQQDARGVTISVYVGDVPGAPQSACRSEMVDGDAAIVVLEQPLGNRPLYDGIHPQNLGVPIYHVK